MQSEFQRSAHDHKIEQVTGKFFDPLDEVSIEPDAPSGYGAAIAPPARLRSRRARAPSGRPQGSRCNRATATVVLVSLAFGLLTPPADATNNRRWDPIRVSPVTLARPAVLVTPNEDVPNPFIVRAHGEYLMFASQAWLSVPITLLVSKSLTRWGKRILDPLPILPKWAQTVFTWSPDVREVDGKYLMWFSAALAKSNASPPMKCIGVARSHSIYGPYVSGERRPLVCQTSHYGSIDPRTFLDPSGRLWLLWKSDDNADWTPTTQTTIFIQRLSANGMRLLGRPVALLSSSQSWENHIIEAPDMVFAGGHYWLFFSANWFNEPTYSIGLAQCAGPTGPCKTSLNGPWLSSNAEGEGPGEETLFKDGSAWWLLYSPSAVHYQSPTDRPAALARIVFGPKGPRVVAPGSKDWRPSPRRSASPPPRSPSIPRCSFKVGCVLDAWPPPSGS